MTNFKILGVSEDLTFDIDVGAVLDGPVPGAQADAVQAFMFLVHSLQGETGRSQTRLQLHTTGLTQHQP